MIYGPKKTAELTAKALELREAGSKWTEICKQLNINKSWLQWHINKAGYQRNDKSRLKTSPANVQKARELRANGMCWKRVEREMGIVAETLRRVIATEDRAARVAEQ